MTCRARIRSENPGASASIRRSMRRANCSCSRSSHRPVMPSSPASQRISCGTWAYAHADSVPGGERDGISGRHLADDEEGPVRHDTDAQLVGCRRQLVEVVGDVHGARRGDRGVGPRDRRRQRPVHLERGRTTFEPREAVVQPRGQVLRLDHRGVEPDGVAVGEHGPAGLDRRPVGSRDTNRSTVADEHTGDRHATAQPASTCFESGDQRTCELTGAASWHGEADLLAEADEQPPDERAVRALRREIGVQGAAGEQQRCVRSAEPFVDEPLERHESDAGQLAQSVEPRRPRQLRARRAAAGMA